MKPDEKIFPVRHYDLAATLTSGQAFRWQSHDDGWAGVIGKRWVHLRATNDGMIARTAAPVADWEWLAHYLQIEKNLPTVVASFPGDEAMRRAVEACNGLRLLRQEPWECLASFILSSTKQIVQIRQIITLLCERFGEPVEVPAGHSPAWSFPTAERLASVTEAELRDCKMGFRAPYLLAAARSIASGKLSLEKLHSVSLAEARAALVSLPGVGPKIADCVLLFAYDFPSAFPVDVWVMKALRQLYFPRRNPSRKRLENFIATYFGAHAGYAQQYLFHYMRVHREEPKPEKSSRRAKRNDLKKPRRA
jgi:N-glycosylase/DNA lyase